MLAMSIHGTGEGPSKGCSFYPFALLEKKKKHKKSTHTHTKKKIYQVCSTPNFLLH